MTPSYELWSAVAFHLDPSWNRIIYFEVLDHWIRAYSSFGTDNCQVKWPMSLDVIAPCNALGYDYYYNIYVTDKYNHRILRLQYDWDNQLIICNNPITDGGLSMPVDLDINDGGTFFPDSDDFLWVVNGNSQIKRFTTDGLLKRTFGEYGC